MLSYSRLPVFPLLGLQGDFDRLSQPVLFLTLSQCGAHPVVNDRTTETSLLTLFSRVLGCVLTFLCLMLKVFDGSSGTAVPSRLWLTAPPDNQAFSLDYD